MREFPCDNFYMCTVYLEGADHPSIIVPISNSVWYVSLCCFHKYVRMYVSLYMYDPLHPSVSFPIPFPLDSSPYPFMSHHHHHHDHHHHIRVHSCLRAKEFIHTRMESLGSKGNASFPYCWLTVLSLNCWLSGINNSR